MKSKAVPNRRRKTSRGIAEAAMRRAARDARETARRFNTPVYVLRDGKIVAEKP